MEDKLAVGLNIGAAILGVGETNSYGVHRGDVQSIYALANKVTKNPFSSNFVTKIVKERNDNYILKTQSKK